MERCPINCKLNENILNKGQDNLPSVLGSNIDEAKVFLLAVNQVLIQPVICKVNRKVVEIVVGEFMFKMKVFEVQVAGFSIAVPIVHIITELHLQFLVRIKVALGTISHWHWEVIEHWK